MILSYQSLKEKCEEGLLDTYSIEQVQPASVDLRLNENITIQPLSLKLGSTIEYVTMPAEYSGRVEGKSSLGRLGLLIHLTAGYVDPGFEGNITLELFNCNNTVLNLKSGMSICQLCLEELDNVPNKLYGECGNHYQGQTGITKSYLEKE